MDIYFLRHANAGSNKAPTPKQDEKRPIDQNGEQESKDVGRVLAHLGVKPDIVISSPLTRAIQTAHLVAEEIGFTDDIALDTALRPEASFEQFQEMLRQYSKAKCIIVVGHNPNFSAFLSLLITKGEVDDAVELKKAAVAKVDVGNFKSGNGAGVLQWCLTPKTIRAAYEAATTSSRPKTSRK
jgi:phosphohistidine phosphatase